ncbi:MAG: trypsin-like peptidase domain-containing protein, partial [Deltaproteobacteria bacterium]|nr:trypsin-like peptidase domain-containing protein [Deltaproteobacteria bacterium]
MMRRIPMMAVALATVLPVTAAAQFQMSPEEEATVRIYTIASVSLLSDYDATGQPLVLAVPEIGHGSGIALSSDGLILTAKHVVEGASALSVKLPRQSQAMPAVIVWEHPTMDYAFIKVRGNFRYYVELPPMGESPSLRTRDDIFAIGYPLDASQSTPSTTEGIVSRMSDDGMLQLSVSLNPGNSGGPVFVEDSDGQPKLVGIVIAKPVEGEGIAWILPIEPISEGYEQDVIPGDYVAKAVEELQGNPERTRLLDKLSVFVAEMVEAYSNPDNPHVFGNMDDAMMLAGLADAGLPEASLLCAGILFNQ